MSSDMKSQSHFYWTITIVSDAKTQAVLFHYSKKKKCFYWTTIILSEVAKLVNRFIALLCNVSGMKSQCIGLPYFVSDAKKLGRFI